MSEKDALKFLVDVLTGFIQLIKHGIIHRDLKPANILIDKGVSTFYKVRFSNWLILALQSVSITSSEICSPHWWELPST